MKAGARRLGAAKTAVPAAKLLFDISIMQQLFRFSLDGV